MRESVLHEAFKGLTAYNTLDKEEFERFVCRYDAGLHETYEHEFSQLDTCTAVPW